MRIELTLSKNTIIFRQLNLEIVFIEINFV